MSPKTNNESSPSSRLMVIVIRKFGRISSYEFSKYWITFFVLLFIFLLAAVGWLAYQNRDLSAERQKLLAQLILTPMDIVPAQPPATTRVEEPILTTEVPPTTTIEAAGVEEEEVEEEEEEEESSLYSSEERRVEMAETTISRPTTTIFTTGQTTTITSTTEPSWQAAKGIEIDEFSIARLGNPDGLKLRYKIVNQGEAKAAGYTFIVAKDESQSPPVYVPFPQEAILSEDRPVNYKQGIQYSIYRFKTIRARIYSDAYLSKVEILVYDSQGDLLLNRTYKVPDV